ncbi:unnamed protein product [Linum tenue]|uniref:NAC domain-containing protein n=1 Tax=Linum tenue TaxID=586396 RepID=A0AAV0HTC4_9ROSI|nr:unnamed protein product [Linum tenue]
MEEKSDTDKGSDDVMLPGFRFHPTDEELVGFYLKRKIQQRSLAIELIKQVDIYKYDPWDLPRVATTAGEKEWYFYCPRDRKYRNSARPNRVTGAGFWKATGTDRPIYSSEGTKCIGLKKSLVFYRGRAAKGIKTDWMMHEFRLPPIPGADQNQQSLQPKKLLDKSLPPNEAWAICRIFKKTNSMAQRALSHHPWMMSSPLHHETTQSDHHFFNQHLNQHQATSSSDVVSCVSELGSSPFFPQQASTPSFSPPPLFPFPQAPNNFIFSSIETSSGSVLSNKASSEALEFEGQGQQFSGFSISTLHQEMESSGGEDDDNHNHNHQWVGSEIRSIGFPFSLPANPAPDDAWDSPPPNSCPTEISTATTTYSTNKCYT